MRAFVTGATGLLGSNLVRALVAAGHEVRALARSRQKADRLLAGTGATVVLGDMENVPGFAPHLAECDVVFHLAAYFREAFGPGTHDEALDRINVGATMSLLDAADAAGATRFVHTSSGGVIGKKSDGSAGDETTPPLPIQTANPYFRSKMKGDAAIAAWKSRGRMAVIEILPGWIWGPFDAAPTGAGKLVMEFVSRKIPANIDGGTSIVDARDVAAAMVAAAERGRDRERYIVGGRFLTMKEIMTHLERTTGVKGPRVSVPHALLLAYAHASEAWATMTGGAPLITPAAVQTMYAKISLDSSKAVRELGASFRPVEDTFRDTAAWLAEAGA